MEVRPNQTVDNSPQHRRHVPATPSKQPVAPSNTADTASVSQRLQKELMSLMMIGGDLGVSAFPEGESIFAWIGTIMGGKGTAYEGLSYKLSLRFPLDYPFKPPQVKFETMCFHPNVDQFGNICLDILQDKWSSAYDCRTILLSIQSLLGEPNPDSPLNNYAAKLWNNEEEAWSTDSIMLEKHLRVELRVPIPDKIRNVNTSTHLLFEVSMPTVLYCARFVHAPVFFQSIPITIKRNACTRFKTMNRDIVLVKLNLDDSFTYILRQLADERATVVPGMQEVKSSRWNTMDGYS
ncbi:hypothetical protein D5086_015764 [Populus alba]|uniref:Uncharacterized protein n=1 Tax=Populus alba TaxID=43335 RepID=A0ACC4BSP4_POPAL